MTKKIKYRKCKICKDNFIPHPSMFLPPTCEKIDCRIEYSNKHLAKKVKQVKKQANKERRIYNQKDVKSLKLKAQQAFNTYIRERDKEKTCISCECRVEKGHASHYYSVGGHSAVRFHVDNVHLGCVKCNVFLHGNLVPYKDNLIKKIGQEKFDKLTELSKQQKFYNAVYYQRIIDIFTKKRKRLKNK